VLVVFPEKMHIIISLTSNTNPTKIRCSGRVGSTCSTSGISCLNLVTNLVISHEWGKDWEVFTTSGTYLSWYDIPELVVPITQDFLDRGLLLTRKPLNKGFLLVEAEVITWLTVMEYLCHNWPWICSTCCKHFPVKIILFIFTL
jgi:hypothetical protein